MTQKLATAVLALMATAGAASAEKIKFEYWYGLTGDLGEVVAQTCTRFNASQDQYEAVCVGQDGYEKAVQNTIAAFRAQKHPTLLQSFDAGTADLMLSGEFYPVTQLMADTGVTIVDPGLLLQQGPFRESGDCRGAGDLGRHGSGVQGAEGQRSGV